MRHPVLPTPCAPAPPVRTRRRKALAALLAACALAPSPAATAAWPEKPIKLVIPYPPGGAADLMGRALAQKLTEQLGKAVVLEHRGGAGGTLGAEAVAAAAPDGYTLLFGTMGTHAINPSVYAKLPYDSQRDFIAVALTHASARVLLVHPGVPARSVADLAALARARPGELTYASAGNGSSSHLAGVYFGALAHVDLVHVPYKGTSPAMVDLLGGRVAMTFDAPSVYLEHIRSGRVRALGVTSSTRMAILPNVPTIAESGLPGYEVANWLGIFAPARTPAEVVARLNGEINRAMTDPAMRKQMQEAGIEPLTGTPQQFAAFLKTEITKWAGIVKASGARAE